MSKIKYCECDKKQTIRHIVDTYSKTKFVGDIGKLHKVEPKSIQWLENQEVHF